ncbi:hypothetical protein [Streptomyces mirabilis]
MDARARHPGKKVFDKPLPTSEPKLRAVLRDGTFYESRVPETAIA